MPADHFTVPTREWAGDAKRTLVQGLHIHKSSGYKIAHQADDVAGQTEQDVVFRCHKPDGSYVGAITLKGVGHGSSVGLYSLSNDSMEFWLGSETHNCVVKVTYTLGDKGVKAVTKTPLPKGDVSIDKSEDALCLRTGNRYRGYRFSDAQAGKITPLWDFRVPAWGKRWQGMLIVDGKLCVHRDVETGGASRVHVFDYPSGKLAQQFDTTDMGDEAEGLVEIDANLGDRFDLEPGIYAVKRTGGTGPSRVIEASRLPVSFRTVTPPAPKRLHGTDISSWQPDWTPASDDTFLFVKTSEGTGYTNPERAKQLDAARDKGLLTGHYHWLTPGNPIGQAAYFVQNTDIRPGDPLWCDWEKQNDGKHPTPAEAAIFIAEVQRLVPTSKVGLYCNRSDWVSTPVKAGDGLWIAEYDVDKPGTTTDWVFWQHTRTPLDRNWAKFTSRADLDKWCNVNRVPVVKPPVVNPAPPVDKPVDVVPPVVEPAPENVGVWAVDPAQVSTVLLGRDANGKTGNALSPAATIADAAGFVKNSVGKPALLRSDGWSYDRSFLVQVGAGPVPATRQLPVVPDYDATERIKFRGRLVCRCVAVSLPWVEHAMLEAGVIKFNLDIYQGGYNTAVSASAGTHAKGGNTDVGQYSDAALRIWREMGWAMQRRTVAQGFSGAHGHGWPKGCPHLSPDAITQRNAWQNGRDGLRQNLLITGPAPKGKSTPNWDDALSAYLKKIGAPPVATT